MMVFNIYKLYFLIFLVKFMLKIFAGRDNINDYEMADVALMNNANPTIVVRPTALDDSSPNGKYEATTVSLILLFLIYENIFVT